MYTNTPNSVSILVKFGELQSVLDWCETHCIGKWEFDVSGWIVSKDPHWTFEFEDEQDCVLFSLTWK